MKFILSHPHTFFPFQISFLGRGLLLFFTLLCVFFPLAKALVKFGKANTNYPGFWGPVTASIDWCESNYAVTYYVAEFFNSISNVFPILSGIFLSMKAKRLNVGNLYVYSALCLCLVGLGSSMFHGTLLFSAQLLDELPMIYMQLTCLYISIQTECRRSLPILKWIFILFALVYSVLHISQRFVLTFHIVFGCILLPSFFYPLKFTAGDKVIQKNQIYCYSMFFISFIAWKLDQVYCDAIEHLYLHAIWHIGTAFSAIYWYTSILYIRLKHIHKNQHISMRWRLMLFPQITEETKVQTKRKNARFSRFRFFSTKKSD